MFALSSSHRFYLYDNHCDMRKSFDGLCGLISSSMQRQATSGEVFVFLNRSRTHIKLLHWEKGGFVLYYKRLERGGYFGVMMPVISVKPCHLKDHTII